MDDLSCTIRDAGLESHYAWDEVAKVSGAFENTTFMNPVTEQPGRIEDVIEDLLDVRGWSDDQIADWIDSLGI